MVLPEGRLSDRTFVSVPAAEACALSRISFWADIFGFVVELSVSKIILVTRRKNIYTFAFYIVKKKAYVVLSLGHFFRSSSKCEILLNFSGHETRKIRCRHQSAPGTVPREVHLIFDL